MLLEDQVCDRIEVIAKIASKHCCNMNGFPLFGIAREDLFAQQLCKAGQNRIGFGITGFQRQWNGFEINSFDFAKSLYRIEDPIPTWMAGLRKNGKGSAARGVRNNAG